MSPPFSDANNDGLIDSSEFLAFLKSDYAIRARILPALVFKATLRALHHHGATPNAIEGCIYNFDREMRAQLLESLAFDDSDMQQQSVQFLLDSAGDALVAIPNVGGDGADRGLTKAAFVEHFLMIAFDSTFNTVSTIASAIVNSLSPTSDPNVSVFYALVNLMVRAASVSVRAAIFHGSFLISMSSFTHTRILDLSPLFVSTRSHSLFLFTQIDKSVGNTAYLDAQLGSADETLGEIFDQFDGDRDGYLDLDELVTLNAHCVRAQQMMAPFLLPAALTKRITAVRAVSARRLAALRELLKEMQGELTEHVRHQWVDCRLVSNSLFV